MSLLSTFSNTLPVIFLVLTGILLRRTQLIRTETVRDLKTLVVSLTLPLLLFKAFASMHFETRYLLIVAFVFGACTIVMLGASALKFLPGLTSPFSAYLMSGFEAGMLGYAVFGAVYGAENISKFAVIDLGQVLFVFFILITRLESQQSRQLNLKQTVGVFLKSPVIIAILLGVLANFSGAYRQLSGWVLTNSLLRAMEILAGLTTPLVALVIGYELGFQGGSLRKSFQTTAWRLPVWVLLAFAFNILVIRQFLGLDPTFEAAVLIMAILPAPFVIPLYLRKGEKSEQDYILNTLSLGTVFALVGAVMVRMIY